MECNTDTTSSFEQNMERVRSIRTKIQHMRSHLGNDTAIPAHTAKQLQLALEDISKAIHGALKCSDIR